MFTASGSQIDNSNSGTIQASTALPAGYLLIGATFPFIASDSNLDDGVTTANTLTYTGTAGITAPTFNATTAASAFQISGLNAISQPNGDNLSLAIGAYALFSQTAGARQNLAVGWEAGFYITSGVANTAIGQFAMEGTGGAPITGGANTAIGYGALSGIQSTSEKNTALGYLAGYDGTALTTGTQNIYLGYKAAASGATVQNETVIGVTTPGAGSNTAVIGNSSVTDVYFGSSTGAATGHAATPTAGDSSNKIATTAFVTTATSAIDTLKVNGTAVVSPFSFTALVNGIGPVGETEVNGFPVANNSPCMIENPINLLAGIARTTATVYQNNTKFPILVVAQLTNATANSIITCVSDNNVAPSTAVWTKIICNSSTFTDSTVFFFVMPGNYYKISATNTPTVQQWREFILPIGTFTVSSDLSGSKSLSTVYQNNSTNTKFISIQLSGVSANSLVQAFSDDTNAPSDVVDSQEQASNTTGAITQFFIVPPGHFYKSTAATGSLAHWYEYTWTIPCAKSANLTPAGAPGKLRSQSSWQRGFANIGNGGTAAALGSFPTTWIPSQTRVTWATVISSIAAGSSQIAMLMGDGIPPFETLVVEDMITTTVLRTIRGPVLAGKGYAVWDTQNIANSLALQSWFEYQLG